MAGCSKRQIEAIISSRDFLLRLTRAKETPNVPTYVRREALALLRHFPPGDRIRSALEAHLDAHDPREPDPLVQKFGIL